MSTTYHFETVDHGLAAKLHAVVQDYHAGKPAAAAAAPPAKPNGVSAAPTPPAAPAAPTPPVAAAPPMPPAAPAATPPAPPAPPAAAPPAAPTAAAPPAGVDPALMQAPEGWTIDHIKSAGAAFTAKHGSGGAAKMAELCAKYAPPGTAKPGVSKVLPAYWPNLYQDLTA